MNNVENFEGDIPIAVGVFQNKVVLKFPRAVEFVEIDQQNCLDIAEAMAACAMELKGEVPKAGQALKKELFDRYREKLINRVTIMFNSRREQKKIANRKLATEVVEVCLREVF